MNKKQARRRASAPMLLRTVGAEELLRAIRRHCLACCGNSRKMVKACTTYDCPLYPYRQCYTLVQTDMFTTTESR